MKILFIGQRGIPDRIEQVATRLVAAGHEVSVGVNGSDVSRHISNYKGIKLISSKWALLRLSFKPVDVVHISDWRMVLMIFYMALMAPKATLVWTIDGMPKRLYLARSLAGPIGRVCDVVTTPRRTMQYLLLHRLGLKTVYVPDGYEGSKVPDIPAKLLGLRANQYVLIDTQDIKTIKWVARAYSKIRSQKKLVVLAEDGAAMKRLKRDFPLLHWAGEAQGRKLESLMNQAAVVILGENSRARDALMAMQAAKPIIATTTPELEETLGVTAQFVRMGDVEGLRTMLNRVISDKRRQREFGRQAARRAKNYFNWSQIVAEYRILYAATKVRPVSLDSARDVLVVSK